MTRALRIGVCLCSMCALAHESLLVVIEEICCLEGFGDEEDATGCPYYGDDAFNNIKPVLCISPKVIKVAKAETHHLHPDHPATPFMYRMPNAIRPPKAPDNADAMNKYAIRMPSSSLVYQLHRKSVIAGNRQPSKKPRKIRVVTRPAKFCTKPVQRHVTPQQKVIVGITLLNWRRLTSSEVGNCLPSDVHIAAGECTYFGENVEDVEY